MGSATVSSPATRVEFFQRPKITLDGADWLQVSGKPVKIVRCECGSGSRPGLLELDVGDCRVDEDCGLHPWQEVRVYAPLLLQDSIDYLPVWAGHLYTRVLDYSGDGNHVRFIGFDWRKRLSDTLLLGRKLVNPYAASFDNQPYTVFAGELVFNKGGQKDLARVNGSSDTMARNYFTTPAYVNSEQPESNNAGNFQMSATYWRPWDIYHYLRQAYSTVEDEKVTGLVNGVKFPTSGFGVENFLSIVDANGALQKLTYSAELDLTGYAIGDALDILCQIAGLSWSIVFSIPAGGSNGDETPTLEFYRQHAYLSSDGSRLANRSFKIDRGSLYGNVYGDAGHVKNFRGTLVQDLANIVDSVVAVGEPMSYELTAETCPATWTSENQRGPSVVNFEDYLVPGWTEAEEKAYFTLGDTVRDKDQRYYHVLRDWVFAPNFKFDDLFEFVGSTNNVIYPYGAYARRHRAPLAKRLKTDAGADAEAAQNLRYEQFKRLALWVNRNDGEGWVGLDPSDAGVFHLVNGVAGLRFTDRQYIEGNYDTGTKLAKAIYAVKATLAIQSDEHLAYYAGVTVRATGQGQAAEKPWFTQRLIVSRGKGAYRKQVNALDPDGTTGNEELRNDSDALQGLARSKLNQLGREKYSGRLYLIGIAPYEIGSLCTGLRGEGDRASIDCEAALVAIRYHWEAQATELVLEETGSVK